MRVVAVAAFISVVSLVRVQADDQKVDVRHILQLRAAVDNTKIDLVKAIELVQRQAKVEQLLIVRLELKENNKPRYGAYFSGGDQFTELEIDTIHGAVLDRKERNGVDQVTGQKLGDVEKAVKGTTITILEAVKASTAHVPGGVPFEAEYRLQAGKPIIEVEMLAGKKLKRVRFNATNIKDVQVEERN